MTSTKGFSRFVKTLTLKISKSTVRTSILFYVTYYETINLSQYTKSLEVL